MNRRLRSVLGLVVLTTMTLAMAEAVLGATCAPMPVMETAMSSASELADDCVMVGCMVLDTPAPDEETPSSTTCPMGMGFAAGCSATASLPTESFVVARMMDHGVVSAVREALMPELLVARIPYHPPRA